MRAPLYGAAVLILAAGLARLISGAIAGCIVHYPRRARQLLAGLFAVIDRLWRRFRRADRRSGNTSRFGGLPPSALGARNVVLMVWDTVRASSLSLYDYPAQHHAQPGSMGADRHPVYACFDCSALDVRVARLLLHRALALYGRPAFQQRPRLRPIPPSRNIWLHGDTRPRGLRPTPITALTRAASIGVSPITKIIRSRRLSLLGRTVPGSWILKNLMSGGDFFDRKWIRLQSRDAHGINDAFLDWLRRVAKIVPFSRSSITLTPTIRTCRRRDSPAVSGYALIPHRDFQLLTDFSHLKTAISAARRCDGPRLLRRLHRVSSTISLDGCSNR